MRLPAFVDIVGVFVNAEPEQIQKVAGEVQLNWVQLHGDESPGFCASLESLNSMIIKALRVQGPGDIEYARNFSVSALLFDAYHPKKYGGTGEQFDWDLLNKAIGYLPYKIFLAGGINPDNVGEALAIDPYAVDVCSGIESEPGKKDYNKMKALFEKVRKYRL